MPVPHESRPASADGTSVGPALDTDVLIVGAGPTGLMAAVELARLGVRCRIVDKTDGPSITSKALAVQARTLEYFDRLGLADRAVSSGVIVRGVQAFADRKPFAHIDFDAIDSRFDYILIYPQSATESLLLEHALGLGVEVERATELVGFSDDGPLVTAVLRNAGQEQRVRAAWLLGCDGAHSAVRHIAGIGFEGTTFEESFALADVELSWDGPRDRLSPYLHEGQVVVFFPLPGGRFRIIHETHETPPPGDPTIEELQHAIDTFGPADAKIRKLEWVSRFRISERQVTAYRKGRVFLAGDAAHIHSPLGGQGMNTGIQDVVNVAWKLALASRGRAAPGLLDSYDAERRPVAKRLLRATGVATRAGVAAGPLLQLARDTVGRFVLSLGFVQKEIQRAVSQVNIGYPESPVVLDALGHGGPLPAGARVTELPVGSKHVLWAPPSGGAGVEVALGEYAEHIERGALPSRLAAEETLVLVRPDGYVGFRCTAADAGAVRRYMARVIGAS